MKRTGNRRGGKCQYIHVLFQFLDLFFVGDAEALFLVDDKQSEIPVDDIGSQYSVGADHNIHQAFFQIRDNLLLLCRRSKP